MEPTGQRVQSKLPDTFLYLPASHIVQLETLEEVKPASQKLQSDNLSLLRKELNPSGQVVQFDEFILGANVPGSHGEHFREPD